MVFSVKDKGVTQPAIVRNLTDDEAIMQMVEDNSNQHEEILPSERAKALKMQLEAIKHQGSRTSSHVGPRTQNLWSSAPRLEALRI